MLQVEQEKPGDEVSVKTRNDLIVDILSSMNRKGEIDGFRKTVNVIRKLDKLSNSALYDDWASRYVKKTHTLVLVAFPNDPKTYDDGRGEGHFRIVLRRVK